MKSFEQPVEQCYIEMLLCFKHAHHSPTSHTRMKLILTDYSKNTSEDSLTINSSKFSYYRSQTGSSKAQATIKIKDLGFLLQVAE